MIRLELPLPCPLNRLYRAMPCAGRGGARFSRQVLSRQARVRRDLLVSEIVRQRGGSREPLLGPVQVQAVVYPRDKRSADADAYLKQLLDCLTKAGVYADDKQVVQVSAERMEPCHPGRIVVEVWEVGA